MSKYNVGDVVKLRDDLEAGKKYGKDFFVKDMDVMKNNPVKIIDVNESDYLTNYGWYITDEMIEGLWEECKGIAYEPYEEKTNKLKLIDVLNMIAKGELKEGTKVKWQKMKYIFEDGELEREGNEETVNIFEDMYCINLNDEEVELIEPPCEHEWEIERIINGIGEDVRVFRRCVKCGFREEAKDNHFADVGKMEKIEELEECEFYTEGAIVAKLNEVIRKINKE